MPIEVEDIVPIVEETVNKTVEEESVVEESVVDKTVVEVDAPKKRRPGRPAGAKNKPKSEAAPPVEQPKKKKAKIVVQAPPPSESESEEEQPPPPSPSTQRKNQWSAYRQKQVDNFQARQAHYSKKLENLLGY